MLFVNVLSKITSDFFREILLLSFFVVGLCHISCQLIVVQLSVVQGLMSPAYWCVAPTGLAGVALCFTACLISYAPTGLYEATQK